jgi:hypothetical protein
MSNTLQFAAFKRESGHGLCICQGQRPGVRVKVVLGKTNKNIHELLQDRVFSRDTVQETLCFYEAIVLSIVGPFLP